jgi:hypothetical protein
LKLFGEVVVLVNNLQPIVEDAVYMEAYPDWWLIYRAEQPCW